MFEIRNAKFNAAGTIDVEWNHPYFGWIPFTASPDDHMAHGRAIYEQALQGSVAPYVVPSPTPEQREAAAGAAIQAHLDAQAVAMGYESIATAVTYADEPAVPKFQTEGQALRAWRSQVWATGYQLLAEVKAGTRPEPTEPELLALLPVFVPPTTTNLE